MRALLNWEESAPAERVRVGLQSLSRENLLGEIVGVAAGVADADRAMSTGFKKLGLLLVELRRRDGDAFQPFPALRELGIPKGTISTGVATSGIAALFLEGRMTNEQWRALSWRDVVELNKVQSCGRLSIMVAARLEVPLPAAHLRAVERAKTADDAAKWARAVVQHGLSVGELAASIEAGEVKKSVGERKGGWHPVGVGRRTVLLGRVVADFDTWRGQQKLRSWTRERCEAALCEMRPMLEFAALIRERMESL
ncbi:MAG TPA: hypothetical protein VIM61_01390 [Chthoniobacterales bacterium]